MAYQLEKINSAIRSDAKGFLEACDAAFSQKVAAAAAAIAENMNKSRIVLLSGPSGSGKTTTAMKIEEVLRGMGVESRSISMDNYFRSIDPHTAPRTEDGEIDYESPLCLDMELLNTHFEKLEAGEAIRIPKFEFARQMRNDSMSAPLRLGSNEIAIFEGIHALGDEIAGRHPNAQKLYISAPPTSTTVRGWSLREPGCALCAGRCAITASAARTYPSPSPSGPTSEGAKSFISPPSRSAQTSFSTPLCLRGVGHEKLCAAAAAGRAEGERAAHGASGACESL
jgi:uridine kinase